MKVLGTTLSDSSSMFTISELAKLMTTKATLFLPNSKLGLRLKVVALIDPAVERATSVLQKKCDSFVRSAYEDTRVFRSLDEYVKNYDRKRTPQAFVIGTPPMFRGTNIPGRDIEIQILESFPHVALFVEKPVATGPIGEVEEAFKVAKFIEEKGTICSVGYN